MGLDMVFYGVRWVEQEETVIVHKADGSSADIPPRDIGYLLIEFGSLRNAHAIDQWITDKTGRGYDKSAFLDEEVAQELVAAIDQILDASQLIDSPIKVDEILSGPVMVDGQVIKDPTMAKKLIPIPKERMGGPRWHEDYDHFYIQDLQQAKQILERLLIDESIWQIIYHPIP